MTTPITLSIPPQANIGICYYHESMGYIARTTAQISQDLATIAQVCKNIKVYHNPLPTNAGGIPNATTLATTKTIVQMAKSQGFHVVWVENIDQGRVLTDVTTNLNNPNSYQWAWADYSTQVVLDAASAQAAGADEFMVGNELFGSVHYYSTDPGTGIATVIYTSANFAGYVSGLVDQCRANFAKSIGYQELDTASGQWHSGTTPALKDLNKIYFDTYESYNTFQDKVATEYAPDFGGLAAIGETSSLDVLGNIGNYVAYTEGDWSRELMRRYDWIRQQGGMNFYAFTYGDPSANSNGFGLRLATADNQSFHDIWSYLLGQKDITYQQYFNDTFPPNDFTGGTGGTGGSLQIDATHTLATATAGATDYVYRGRMQWQAATGTVRIIARYTDSNNYYCINIDVTNNQAKFIRRQGGTETQLGQTVPWPPQGSYQGSFSNSTFTNFDFEIRVQGLNGNAAVWAAVNTYKLVDKIDTGNTALSSATVGVLYDGVTTVVSNIVCHSIDQVNILTTTPPPPPAFTIGLDCEVLIDGQGYWIQPYSYKMHQPRVRKAAVRADNGEGYVDLGPGKRIWQFVVLCLNDLVKYDGTSTGFAGQNYRDALRASYNKPAGTIIQYGDPISGFVNVHFDSYLEVARDLKTQQVQLATAQPASLSYMVAIELVEA